MIEYNIITTSSSCCDYKCQGCHKRVSEFTQLQTRFRLCLKCFDKMVKDYKHSLKINQCHKTGNWKRSLS